MGKSPKKEKSFVIRSVAMPRDVDAALDIWCGKNERTRSFAIAKAVREFLEKDAGKSHVDPTAVPQPRHTPPKHPRE
jgi:hypothetical protein